MSLYRSSDLKRTVWLHVTSCRGRMPYDVWELFRPCREIKDKVVKATSRLVSGSPKLTADSKQLEHGSRMIDFGLPSFFGLRLQDGHVPTITYVRRRLFLGNFLWGPGGPLFGISRAQ